MVYTYFCDTCKKTVEVTKAVKDSSNEEKCICGDVMRKIFSNDKESPAVLSGTKYKRKFNANV